MQNLIKEYGGKIFTSGCLLIRKQQSSIDGGILLFISEWESLPSTFVIVQIQVGVNRFALDKKHVYEP
jgi:hypothetical protein